MGRRSLIVGKEFEREMARAFGGKRYWANSGLDIDVESDTCVVQCKCVARMSLEDIAQLAEIAERQGRVKSKAGVVAIKVRRGAGRPTTTLIVQTLAVWAYQHGEAPA